ncbi:MAG: TIGR04282 family arsenosugar biosynthesis glycosyltransferase [Rhodothermales bacterium]
MIGGEPALIVFAKVPEPGTVKTRLTSLLTEAEAARLYDAFLRDALDAYRGLGVAVRLYLGPSIHAAPEGLVPGGVSLHAQRGDGLGERMLNAFVETFVAGHDRAVVIGTDHPTLPLAFVAQAFEELASPFATVIGPSDDGGYYLLGMNEVYPQLFEGMDYSHPDVFADTLQRAHTTPAAISILPTWYDVDTPAALERLAADLDREPGGASKTREVMAELREKYERLA